MAVRHMTADELGTVRLSAQISPRLKQRLVVLALHSGHSLTGLTNYALEAMLNNADVLHDENRLRLAQQMDARDPDQAA